MSKKDDEINKILEKARASRTELQEAIASGLKANQDPFAYALRDVNHANMVLANPLVLKKLKPTQFFQVVDRYRKDNSFPATGLENIYRENLRMAAMTSISVAGNLLNSPTLMGKANHLKLSLAEWHEVLAAHQENPGYNKLIAKLQRKPLRELLDYETLAKNLQEGFKHDKTEGIGPPETAKPLTMLKDAMQNNKNIAPDPQIKREYAELLKHKGGKMGGGTLKIALGLEISASKEIIALTKKLKEQPEPAELKIYYDADKLKGTEHFLKALDKLKNALENKNMKVEFIATNPENMTGPVKDAVNAIQNREKPKQAPGLN